MHPARLHVGARQRDLGEQLAELRAAAQHIDPRSRHFALDRHRHALRIAAVRKPNVIAVGEDHAREVLQGEIGLARRAIAIAGHHDAADGGLRPGHANDVRAGHLLGVRRRLEGERGPHAPVGADHRTARSDEDDVAVLEAEGRRIAGQQEVIEIEVGDDLAAAAHRDVAVGAVGGDPVGLVQEKQDTVVCRAEIAARLEYVAADEHPDGSGVVHRRIDAHRAGKDPADGGRHDALQLGGRGAADADRTHPDHEDVAAGVHGLNPAGVDCAVEVDDHLVAGLDQVVGAVGRTAAGEGPAEQLGAEQRQGHAVRQLDVDDRRLKLVQRDRGAHRGRARRRPLQGID